MKEKVGEKAKLQESLFSLADVNDIYMIQSDQASFYHL